MVSSFFFFFSASHSNCQNATLVLNYLEGMSREGDEPDNTPPRSIVDPTEYRSRAGSAHNGNGALFSPAPRSQRSDGLLELANSPMSYTNRNGNGVHHSREEDDVASDVQEGVRSEVGETILPVVCHIPYYMTLLLMSQHPSANLDHTTRQVPNMSPMTLGHPLVILALCLQMICHQAIYPTALGMYVCLSC